MASLLRYLGTDVAIQQDKTLSTATMASSASQSIALVSTPKPCLHRFPSKPRLDTNFNIIPIAFLNVIKNPTTVNFSNAGRNCTVFPGTQLLRCPEIEFISLTEPLFPRLSPF